MVLWRAVVALAVAAALVGSGCEAGAAEEPGRVPDGVTAETGKEGEAAGSTASAAPAPAKRGAPRARVAEVIDGDTIRLADGRRVRLVQIDAPEATGECFGSEAAGVLRRLVPPRSHVRLERDPALDDVDRYRRLLRYVFRGGANVNLALVRRGAASVWFYDGDRGRYGGRLLAAARQARAGGRGAWGACRARLDPNQAFTTRPRADAGAAAAPSGCHPSYAGACLNPSASDYDCAGGEGDGPRYTGPVRVVGPDEYGLDPDGDGVGCPSSP